MSSKPFQFKQFSVAQDRCAMKIGTDGVLLGAWASLKNNPNTILDIGTGTGVIALMLAQRSDAMTIDAVELDDNAYEQATENFENSNWSDRLFCYHAHLYEFAAEVDDTYDMIICNPPFHETHLSAESRRLLRSRSESDGASKTARENARFDDAMPFELLVGAVSKLLSASGRFQVIIPFDRENDFILLCSRAHLYPTRITSVKGTPTSSIKRSLMEFAFDSENVATIGEQSSEIEDPEVRFRESATQPPPQRDELIIEEGRHEYTEKYIALVKDFYLKM